ncbi:metallophosphoesterase family protein [Bifidobacterium miconisargentati]|uniref:metallophosphoesterase family protein n=1 Tax=Bifidobacterium miconisargentati TaxID=2834437 RepID=UPI001BDD9623|nr:metallophosphoesterase family protein [Bifidobacterium miconisargentati]MBW3089950.1 metallophosphoesterase family protein [Bifidobacterium miconisargentati]
MTSLRFREDGSFRVLQMADVQDGPDVRPDTIHLIREAIRASDPDLVVFTGDQIRGYDPAYIDTFLRRRGEEPGARVRAVTEVEAKLRGIKRHPVIREAAGKAAGRIADRLTEAGRPVPAKISAIAGITNAGTAPADAPAGSDPASPSSPEPAAITTTLAPDAPATMDELMDQTREKVRRTFSGFLGPIVEAGVPFAATYGNHDFQCGILADEQDDIYREFPGCLNPQDSLEPGTFALPIESSDGSGRVAMSVMMVNSGDYAGKPEENDAQYPAYVVNSRGLDLADADGYGTPSPEAIDWLRDVQTELGERNGDGKPVPAIAFQHIPPQEFYDCLKEVPAWTPNSVEGARSHAGHCYVLDHTVCRPGSRLGEAIGCADENVGEVSTLTEAGGYFALFCGHDHKNAFVGHVHGIDLGYAPTCGFECYGPKSRYRGIRLFEFHESNPAGYVTRMLTWGDLVGRYSSNEVRVWFEDHCITDAIGIRNELRRPQVFAVLAGAMSLGFIAIIHSLLKQR